TSVRLRCFPSFSADVQEDSWVSSPHCSQKVGSFGVRSVRETTYEVAPDRAQWGTEIAGKVKAWAKDLLERMARNGVDFTLFFRRLCDSATGPDDDAAVRNLFTDPSSFDDWVVRWRHRLAEERGEANQRRTAMRAANPAFIPRNHLVEEAISAAVNDGNFAPFETLLMVLSMPY